MPTSPTKEEWSTAKLLLSGALDGTKLRYTAIKAADGTLSPAKGREELFDAIKNYNNRRTSKTIAQTTNTFIVLGKKIYAMTKEVIAVEDKRKVFYAFDEDNTLCIIKKTEYLRENEAYVLKDRGLSAGTFIAKNPKNPGAFYYTQMKYLGRSFNDVLKNEDISDDMRWKLGIKACLELLDLHKIRSKSLSKISIEHHDLNLNNLTLDESGNVHLIDFEHAEENLLIPRASTGTAAYQPHDTSNINFTYGFCGEYIDTFALKRLLKMPTDSWFTISTPENSTVKETFFSSDLLSSFTSILSEKIWDTHPEIHQYIDTTGFESNINYVHKYDKIKVCSIAAILITVRYNLLISIEILAKDIQLSMAICGIYSNLQNPNKKAIETLLSEPQSVIRIAAFFEMGQYEKMERYMNDTHFRIALGKSKSHEEACILVILKSYELGKYYSKINPELVAEIYRKQQFEKKYWTKDIIISLFKEAEFKKIASLYQNKVFYDTAYLIAKKYHLPTTKNKLAANYAFLAKIISTIDYINKNSKTKIQFPLFAENAEREMREALLTEKYTVDRDFFNAVQHTESIDKILLLLLLKTHNLHDYYSIIDDISTEPFHNIYHRNTEKISSKYIYNLLNQSFNIKIQLFCEEGNHLEAALLLTKKFYLPFSHETLCNDIHLAQGICALYLKSKFIPIDSEAFKKSVPCSKKHLYWEAAFFCMNKQEERDEYMADLDFCKHMQIENYKRHCLIILMKSLDLSDYYSRLDNNELLEILYFINKQYSFAISQSNILKILENPALERLFITLHNKHYDQLISTFLTNDEFNLQNLPTENNWEHLTHILDYCVQLFGISEMDANWFDNRLDNQLLQIITTPKLFEAFTYMISLIQEELPLDTKKELLDFAQCDEMVWEAVLCYKQLNSLVHPCLFPIRQRSYLYAKTICFLAEKEVLECITPSSSEWQPIVEIAHCPDEMTLFLASHLKSEPVQVNTREQEMIASLDKHNEGRVASIGIFSQNLESSDNCDILDQKAGESKSYS